MFRLDKLTQKAQEALQQAQAIAEKQDSQVMFPAASADRPGRGEGGHRPAGAGKVRRAAGRHRGRSAHACSANLPKTAGMQPGMYLSQPLNQVLERAFDEATPFQGRIRLHRAPPAGHRRAAQRPRRPTARPRRRHPRRHPEGAGLGPRHAARHRPESRIEIPGAGALRPRPDRIRAPGQARPGDRPRRGNPPRDAGAQPPHQEQPGADRRARRGQDRHRGRPGPAHRARRRARPAARTRSWSPSTSAR